MTSSRKSQSPHGEIRRGLFFEIPELDGGRPARRRISQRPSPGRRGRAVVRAFNRTHYWPARANVSGLRRGSSPPHAAPENEWIEGSRPQMICACTAIMPHVFVVEREADDRLPDIARARRPDCHRRIGGMLVSAEIIRLIPRPRRDDEQTDFPTIAFRSAVPDLTMNHADAVPCKHVFGWRGDLSRPRHSPKSFSICGAARRSVEQAQSYTFKAVMRSTVIVTGFVARSLARHQGDARQMIACCGTGHAVR